MILFVSCLEIIFVKQKMLNEELGSFFLRVQISRVNVAGSQQFSPTDESVSLTSVPVMTLASAEVQRQQLQTFHFYSLGFITSVWIVFLSW